jgi:hypothetical protein
MIELFFMVTPRSNQWNSFSRRPGGHDFGVPHLRQGADQPRALLLERYDTIWSRSFQSYGGQQIVYLCDPVFETRHCRARTNTHDYGLLGQGSEPALDRLRAVRIGSGINRLHTCGRFLRGNGRQLATAIPHDNADHDNRQCEGGDSHRCPIQPLASDGRAVLRAAVKLLPVAGQLV